MAGHLQALDVWTAEVPSEVKQRQEALKLVELAKARFEDGNEIVVPEDLDLSCLDEISYFPEGLSVLGSLDLRGCLSLQKLPEGLKVQGDLNLGQCESIRLLPEGLSVGGSINLSRCSGLLKLTKIQKVNGDLDLADCVELCELSDSLHVAGDLDLSDCTKLMKLPSDLHVEGNMTLTENALITALPTNLYVGGNLEIQNCSGITSLPDTIEVGEGISLAGCTNIRSLPDGLEVHGDLYLGGSTGLSTLPEGLVVAGSLYLDHCTGLTMLPSQFSVGMELNLEHCSSLETIPACILDWPLTPEGDRHVIFLGMSGLSQDTLEWLRNAEIPNLQFLVNLDWLRAAMNSPTNRVSADLMEQPLFNSIHEAIQFWANCCNSQPPAVDLDLPGWKSIKVLQFLTKLRGAKEFGILETRYMLAQRVLEALKLISDPHFQDEVIQRMGDSLDACSDKPIWALNQIVLVSLVAEARGNREKLRDLGRRVLNLMIVHNHVEKKIKSLAWVDDVCVYLRFEIELKEELDLPVAATEMIFPRYIEVTSEELENAKQEARDVTEEDFDSWLLEWSEWQRQLRLESTESLRWSDLDLDEDQRDEDDLPTHDLSGEPLIDPVRIRGTVWSLSDVLRHWINTGSDLENNPLTFEEIKASPRCRT